MKKAPALHLLHETEGPEMKTDETVNPRRTGSAERRPWPPSRREGARKEKKALGPRKPLIRLDSAKEIKGNPRIFLG
jgi:hypothetical protein